MKTITITIESEGNSVSREYNPSESTDWASIVESMFETLEKSYENKF